MVEPIRFPYHTLARCDSVHLQKAVCAYVWGGAGAEGVLVWRRLSMLPPRETGKPFLTVLSKRKPWKRDSTAAEVGP